MKTTLRNLAPVLALSGIVLVGCGEKSDPENPATDNASTDTNSPIEEVFLDQAPEGAVSVIEARKSAEPGKEITVRGRIAGAMQPFSADYATIVLADETLMTCDKSADEGCTTPWDACCVESEKIAASRMTVQVVGEDGRPLEQSLKNLRNLTELDGLTITGTVAEGSSEENLIVNATGIFPEES